MLICCSSGSRGPQGPRGPGPPDPQIWRPKIRVWQPQFLKNQITFGGPNFFLKNASLNQVILLSLHRNPLFCLGESHICKLKSFCLHLFHYFQQYLCKIFVQNITKKYNKLSKSKLPMSKGLEACRTPC